MNDKSPWLLALTTANFVFLAALAVGAFYVKDRLETVERTVAAGPPARGAAERGGREAPRTQPAPEAPAGSLEDVVKRLQKLSDDQYDHYSELANDLHQLKQTVKRTDVTTRRLRQALTAPGQPSGEWKLAPLGAPLTPEVLETYRTS
jgi:hypothetical protein